MTARHKLRGETTISTCPPHKLLHYYDSHSKLYVCYIEAQSIREQTLLDLVLDLDLDLDLDRVLDLNPALCLSRVTIPGPALLTSKMDITLLIRGKNVQSLCQCLLRWGSMSLSRSLHVLHTLPQSKSTNILRMCKNINNWTTLMNYFSFF